MIVGAGRRRVVFYGPPPEDWAFAVLAGANVELVEMPFSSASEQNQKLRVQYAD